MCKTLCWVLYWVLWVNSMTRICNLIEHMALHGHNMESLIFIKGISTIWADDGVNIPGSQERNGQCIFRLKRTKGSHNSGFLSHIFFFSKVFLTSVFFCLFWPGLFEPCYGQPLELEFESLGSNLNLPLANRVSWGESPNFSVFLDSRLAIAFICHNLPKGWLWKSLQNNTGIIQVGGLIIITNFFSLVVTGYQCSISNF